MKACWLWTTKTNKQNQQKTPQKQTSRRNDYSIKHWQRLNLKQNLPLPWIQLSTESARLEGTTGGHLVQPPCSSRITPEHMAQDCIQMVLEYHQEGDLGNLFQGTATLTVRFFLTFRWNFLYISFCPLPLVLLLIPSQELRLCTSKSIQIKISQKRALLQLLRDTKEW